VRRRGAPRRLRRGATRLPLYDSFIFAQVFIFSPRLDSPARSAVPSAGEPWNLKRQKIVVVEDEPDILEIIEYNLAREGFRVITSRDGAEGLKKIRSELPDLVLLDLMLPGLDGLEICRRLRADEVTRALPVVMVTAKGEEADIVVGLGMGADDYLVKPFSPRELLARIKAVLRRSQGQAQSGSGERVELPGLVVDVGRHEVRVHDAAVTFTPTELRLLHFLASHPGRVFTRDQLLARAIGEHAVVIDRNIDVHVRSIRKKLGEERERVETVRGVGYRFRDERG
jgi:two-component system alkaline phosphatase synthesis response regulator PhoP